MESMTWLWLQWRIPTGNQAQVDSWTSWASLTCCYNGTLRGFLLRLSLLSLFWHASSNQWTSFYSMLFLGLGLIQSQRNIEEVKDAIPVIWELSVKLISKQQKMFNSKALMQVHVIKLLAVFFLTLHAFWCNSYSIWFSVTSAVEWENVIVCSLRCLPFIVYTVYEIFSSAPKEVVLFNHIEFSIFLSLWTTYEDKYLIKMSHRS